MRILESVDDAQVPPIGNVLEGRHFFAVAFPGVGTMAWLVLSLKHALRNIICILESLDVSQTPLIESVLEGRHFFVVGFPRVGTMGTASIIIETYFQEYNTYSRVIRH